MEEGGQPGKGPHLVGKKDDLIKAKNTVVTAGGRDLLVVHHQGVFYALDCYCYRTYRSAIPCTRRAIKCRRNHLLRSKRSKVFSPLISAAPFTDSGGSLQNGDIEVSSPVRANAVLFRFLPHGSTAAAVTKTSTQYANTQRPRRPTVSLQACLPASSQHPDRKLAAGRA